MNEIMEKFKKHARSASYHYADDTMREWDIAHKDRDAALALHREYPELRGEMDKHMKMELWHHEYIRLTEAEKDD